MITKTTESPRRGVPLRPDWSSYSPPPFVARAMVAAARHCFDPTRFGSVEEVARALWPRDEATVAVLQRAASAPHSTSNAAALVVEAVGTFLASLAPLSASASLFAAAPRISLGQYATVRIPGRADPFAAGDAVWVAEGDPAPVIRLDTATAATLGPLRKMLAITAASRELVEASDAEIDLGFDVEGNRRVTRSI